jgi:hypothetical protein
LIPVQWNRSVRLFNVYEKSRNRPLRGNNFGPSDLVRRHLIEMANKRQEAELVMISRIIETSEQIDGKTSRSICDAVGERLQQNLRPDSLRPSTHLQHLVDELRKRDGENRLRSSN